MLACARQSFVEIFWPTIFCLGHSFGGLANNFGSFKAFAWSLLLAAKERFWCCYAAILLLND
jgi:hypothetical protein